MAMVDMVGGAGGYCGVLFRNGRGLSGADELFAGLRVGGP
jgi:hypothetical protein